MTISQNVPHVFAALLYMPYVHVIHAIRMLYMPYVCYTCHTYVIHAIRMLYMPYVSYCIVEVKVSPYVTVWLMKCSSDVPFSPVSHSPVIPSFVEALPDF